MECGAPLSASLRCRILFAGESRLALAHGDWVCLHGVRGVFECWNHQCLVGRKLLPHRIAPRCRTVLCVHRSGVDDHPARNLFRSNVQATTDSDVFRVLPHDSLVRRTARSRFHGSLHRAAGKVTFQSSWPTCGARQVDYGWKPSPPVTRAVLEIRWTGGGDRQGDRSDGRPFEARGLHTNVHRWISSAGMVLCGGFAADSRPSSVPSELWRPGYLPAATLGAQGGKVMNSESVNFRAWRTSMNSRTASRISGIALGLLLCSHSCLAGETRRLTLAEAVRLAVEQNRTLKIARLKVKENEYKKDAARSAYFPTITNESDALHISELQALSVPQGAFGVVSGIPIPAQNTNLPQGKQTLYSSGTTIAQPLTQLLRIHQENRAAAAEIAMSRDELRNGENEVALQVHALYYGILVAQMQKKAAEQETAFASETLRENEHDVQGGSALEGSEIQSRASLLDSQHPVLTAERQIQDFTTELNDLLGIPLDTQLELQPEDATHVEALSKADCIKAAWEENPEIQSAEATIQKARAGVAAAKTAYIPDVTAFARHRYQDGVPFLERNFGTVGITVNYTLWDFGKRHANVRESQTELAEAEQNLERLKDQVAVDIERSYNKVERTKNMVNVALQVAKLREESERLAGNQQQQGLVLVSDVRQASAANYKAKADLLQASLAYLLAWAELQRTMGHTPGAQGQ